MRKSQKLGVTQSKKDPPYWMWKPGLRDWVGRKGLRLYSLFWAGGWRLLECAWGRVIMWPLGTPDPQQKPGMPLSVGCSRILQTEKRPFSPLLQPVSGVTSLWLYNNIFPSKRAAGTSIPNNVAALVQQKSEWAENVHVNFGNRDCDIPADVTSRKKCICADEGWPKKNAQMKVGEHDQHPNPHPTHAWLLHLVEHRSRHRMAEIYQPTCIPAGSLGHLLLSTLSKRSD